MFPELASLAGVDSNVQSVLWCSLCAKKPAEGEWGKETYAGSNEWVDLPVCKSCGHQAISDPTLDWLDKARTV